jgi:hypothetical protein
VRGSDSGRGFSVSGVVNSATSISTTVPVALTTNKHLAVAHSALSTAQLKQTNNWQWRTAHCALCTAQTNKQLAVAVPTNSRCSNKTADWQWRTVHCAQLKQTNNQLAAAHCALHTVHSSNKQTTNWQWLFQQTVAVPTNKQLAVAHCALRTVHCSNNQTSGSGALCTEHCALLKSTNKQLAVAHCALCTVHCTAQLKQTNNQLAVAVPTNSGCSNKQTTGSSALCTAHCALLKQSNIWQWRTVH